MTDPVRPLFLTLEGGDGVGKSTQQRLLAQWFREAGREVIETREPGGTALGKELRRLILHGDHVDPRAEALMYAADRAHHIASVVRPALERGAVVVQDRYLDSSVAYQGAARALGVDEVRDLSVWATRGLLPDATILLDLDPQRARLSGQRDRLEREGSEFHEAVRERFLAMAEQEPERWIVVDAAGTPEGVQAAIRAALTERGLA
ncbi:MAG: dTMP kinase [Ruaniaceae bacterium]|nr:dTMP kinase [Ruaniaceae bacterium]